MNRNNQHQRMMNRCLPVLFFVCFYWLTQPVHADLTFSGSSGFILAPSSKTIKHGQVEMAARTRQFKVPKSGDSKFLTSLSLGFSPLRDLEMGVQKSVDSRRGANDFDPDPTVNVKVRLPPIGTGDFSELALGGVFDTNPNNYHTLYFSLGGVGLGWNFGGNPGSGVANFGSYDKTKKEPKSLFLLLGADLTPGKAGERGYRSHYYVDYNGDVFSIAWRLQSHRGFWIDAALHSQSEYDFMYNHQPLSIGIGANF